MMTAPTAPPPLTAARAAQQRYLEHVRLAVRCACATGGLCAVARDLDADAHAAYFWAEARRLSWQARGVVAF